MDPLKLLVATLFCLTYVLVVIFYHKKAYFAWFTAFVFLIVGVLKFSNVPSIINWNVIGIYVGMLFISEAFIVSKVPDYLAILFTNKTSKVWSALLFICFFSGIISIFLENVAVVLIVAPIAFSIAKRIKINPVPLLIGIAVSSNLQGVATLIGDPPSMILGGFAKLTFNDFFLYQGKPGLFWCVQIAAIASLFVLWFIFRKLKQPLGTIPQIRITSITPSLLIILLVLLLAVSSFFENGFSYTVGIICMLFGMASLFWIWFTEKKGVVERIKAMDWETAFFLMAIFLLVEGLVSVGLIDDLGNFIFSLTGTNVFLAFNLIIWMSVFFSAFVDNVPYIVTMLPVVDHIASGFNLPHVRTLFLFGLVLAASVGGNITPVGASANIVALGQLKNKGYHVNFWQFVRIGLPFTIVSVGVAELLLWFIWMY